MFVHTSTASPSILLLSQYGIGGGNSNAESEQQLQEGRRRGLTTGSSRIYDMTIRPSLNQLRNRLGTAIGEAIPLPPAANKQPPSLSLTPRASHNNLAGDGGAYSSSKIDAEVVGDIFAAVSMSLAALDSISVLTETAQASNGRLSQQSNYYHKRANAKQVPENTGVWTTELASYISSYLLDELDGNVN